MHGTYQDEGEATNCQKRKKWLELKNVMKSSKCQLKFIKKVSFTSDIGCVIIENCHSPEYVM